MSMIFCLNLLKSLNKFVLLFKFCLALEYFASLKGLLTSPSDFMG